MFFRQSVNRRRGQGLLFLAALLLTQTVPALRSWAEDASLPSGLIPLPSLRPSDALRPFLPQALAVDGLGRLFVLDRARGQILEAPAAGDSAGDWTTFGVGDQGGARYPNLAEIFARWGPDLFALDPVALSLYQFDLQGRLTNTITLGEGLPPNESTRLQPVDFALSRSGELLLLDRSGERLLHFDRYGSFLSDWTASSQGGESLLRPSRLAETPDGNVYVLDPAAGKIHAYSREGSSLGVWPYADGLPGEEEAPLFTVTPWGRLLLAGRTLGWLRLFDSQGLRLLDWRNPRPSDAPLSDLVMTSDSLVLAACPRGGEIQRFRWAFPDSAGRGGR